MIGELTGEVIALSMTVAAVVTVVIVDVARRWYIRRSTERRRREWQLLSRQPWNRWHR